MLLRFLLADLLSTDAVLRLLGVVAILTGLVRLSGAFHDDPVGGDRRLPRSRAVLASLELALGTLLLLTPGSVEATAMRSPCGDLWQVPSCSPTRSRCGAKRTLARCTARPDDRR